jgi:hypothetical protein
LTTIAKNLSKTRTEPIFERHAWKILLVVIIITGLFGLSDIFGSANELQNGETVFMHSVTGMSWNELKAQNPRVANMLELFLKISGAALTLLALLSLVVCLTGFRRGERWAWFALWAIPLWNMSVVYFIQSADRLPDSGTPVPVISGSILSLICLAALGLSCRKFFQPRSDPKKGENNV